MPLTHPSDRHHSVTHRGLRGPCVVYPSLRSRRPYCRQICADLLSRQHRLEALTEVSAFKSWQPFIFSEFKGWLNEFVEAQLAPVICAELAEKLFAARSQLLKYIGELTVSPIALLAGRPDAFQAAEDYLESYDQLLKQLQASYQEMFSQAMDEAERIVHWLLAMELYVYHRDSTTEVLLSAIHPLNLWRSVAIVKDLQLLGGKLSDRERKTLIEAAAEDIQFLNVLVLPKIASSDGQTKLLGQAGVIAHLPMFKEAPRGVLEPDGIVSINRLAQLIAYLRPFARPGLQVLLINAPRPSKFIESILEALDLDNTATEDTFWGVHFRFRYTSEDTRGWTSCYGPLKSRQTNPSWMRMRKGACPGEIEEIHAP